MKRTDGRRVCWVLFLIYCAALAWLLFGRAPFNVGGTYWEQVAMNLNLRPLYTIQGYWRIATGQGNPYLIRHACINLAGNVAAFVPLGFFLPWLFRRLRPFFPFLGCTVLIILVIELVQLFTLVGSCDVDDLILNLPGALLGWAAARLILWCRARRGPSSSHRNIAAE